MLQVKDINVYYGAIHAIKGISLEVSDGEIVALIGSNGAGKSTTLRTISGLMKPKSGSIIYDDKANRLIRSSAWAFAKCLKAAGSLPI